MAVERETGSGNTFLALLIGAMLVALLVIGYFVYSGGRVDTSPSRDLNVKIETPNLPSPQVPAPAPDAPTPAQ